MYSESLALFKCPKEFYSKEFTPTLGVEFGKALGNLWHDAIYESVFTCGHSWECPTHIINWFANHIEVDFNEKLFLTYISKEQLIALAGGQPARRA